MIAELSGMTPNMSQRTDQNMQYNWRINTSASSWMESLFTCTSTVVMILSDTVEVERSREKYFGWLWDRAENGRAEYSSVE